MSVWIRPEELQSIYDAIQDQTEQLVRLLGDDFETFAYELERI